MHLRDLLLQDFVDCIVCRQRPPRCCWIQRQPLTEAVSGQRVLALEYLAIISSRVRSSLRSRPPVGKYKPYLTHNENRVVLSASVRCVLNLQVCYGNSCSDCSLKVRSGNRHRMRLEVRRRTMEETREDGGRSANRNLIR